MIKNGKLCLKCFFVFAVFQLLLTNQALKTLQTAQWVMLFSHHSAVSPLCHGNDSKSLRADFIINVFPVNYNLTLTCWLGLFFNHQEMANLSHLCVRCLILHNDLYALIYKQKIWTILCIRYFHAFIFNCQHMTMNVKFFPYTVTSLHLPSTQVFFPWSSCSPQTWFVD